MSNSDPVPGPEAFAMDERLAVYGSLAPGEANAHLLAAADGIWVPATVRGELDEAGWAAAAGYKGIRLSADAPAVPVLVCCSRVLPSMWEALDRFEGEDYRRTVTTALADGQELAVNIYELR